MTRRTETEKPQRRGCGFLFDEPDFAAKRINSTQESRIAGFPIQAPANDIKRPNEVLPDTRPPRTRSTPLLFRPVDMRSRIERGQGRRLEVGVTQGDGAQDAVLRRDGKELPQIIFRLRSVGLILQAGTSVHMHPTGGQPRIGGREQQGRRRDRRVLTPKVGRVRSPSTSTTAGACSRNAEP